MAFSRDSFVRAMPTFSHMMWPSFLWMSSTDCLPLIARSFAIFSLTPFSASSKPLVSVFTFGAWILCER